MKDSRITRLPLSVFKPEILVCIIPFGGDFNGISEFQFSAGKNSIPISDNDSLLNFYVTNEKMAVAAQRKRGHFLFVGIIITAVSLMGDLL